MILHVYPKDDIDNHSLSPFCKCGAKSEVDDTGENILIAHVSFDGREFLDDLADIPGIDLGQKPWIIIETEDFVND